MHFHDSGGRPARVLQATASVWRGDKQVAYARAVRDADDKSVVRVEELARGLDFRVRARIQGFGEGVFGPWNAGASEAVHRVQLPALGAAVVTVLDGDGAPRAQVRVACRRDGFRDRRLRTSGLDGLCSFDRPPPGRWKIFLARDVTGNTPLVDVRSGDSARVVLRYPARSR